MLAGKSSRSNPAIYAAEGDDQIRTGVPARSTLDSKPRFPEPRSRRRVWLLVAVFVCVLVANLAHQGGVG